MREGGSPGGGARPLGIREDARPGIEHRAEQMGSPLPSRHENGKSPCAAKVPPTAKYRFVEMRAEHRSYRVAPWATWGRGAVTLTGVQMRIAQVAPLTEAVPPKLYGGTERVVHWLTEELVS